MAIGPGKLTFDKVMKLFPLKKARDIQADAIRKTVAHYVNGAQYVVLEAPVGCHEKGTPIMLVSGSTRLVEDIKVGDSVMGSDGMPQRVTELKRGRSKMVRIIPTKGDSFVVNVDHILTLVETETSEVVDVRVRDFFEWSAWKASQHKLFRAPVELFFENQVSPLDISPYVMGLLLGDGALTKGVQICKADEELVEPLKAEATKFGLQYRFSGDVHRIVNEARKPNTMYGQLKGFGLAVISEERFIPPVYKTSSKEDRLQVLAGLMDTDGHLSCGGFDYISKSYQLADDVVFVARSVGLAAYLSPCEKHDQFGLGGVYYRVSISGDCSFIPTRITRKQSGPRKQKKNVLRTGFTWELLPEDDFFGFSLDGDGRFLLGDFTVTHNTGKSAIAIAFARAMGDSSYMLTLTEQLQDQYTTEFGEKAAKDLGLRSLKGRGKFKCVNMPGGTCNDGKHLYKGKNACTGCPYKKAKQEAFEAPHLVANYHSYLWNVAMAPPSEEGPPPIRPLLIVDEAHSMESFLLDQMGVTVKLGKLSVQLPPPPSDEETAEPYFDYITEELLPALAEVGKKLIDPKAKEEHEQFIRKLTMVISTKDDVQWVPERGKVPPFFTTMDQTWFALKPLTVDRWGSQLWGNGQQQLFMSGTILSAMQFVKSVGLDPELGEHVELDSPFPAANRPIHIGNLDMTKKHRATNWPIMARMVEGLLSAHPNEKGLLLCPSNEMIKAIGKALSRTNFSRLIVAAGEDRVAQYQRHMNSKTPTVLAASGYWEGADLKDDASRFQIIPQAPRPMWQGQVAARASKPGGDDWYRWLTWQKFLQGTGRSVRSETDTAVTYVFDSELRKELKRKDTMIPKWVRDACHLTPEKKES